MQINHTPGQALLQQHGIQAPSQSQKVLKMVQNDRMAGSVPSWQDAKSQHDVITADLSHAMTQTQNSGTSQNALALAPNQTMDSTQGAQPFGFGDLLDMVNPLHHIPLVGSAYRELSGDQIRPVSRLIGGSVFGGLAGLASGIVNIIAEEETGRDVAGNALHYMASGESPRYKNRLAHDAAPEQALERALSDIENGSSGLPVSMMAFAAQDSNPASIKRPAIEQKVPFRAL